jgi:hypothetical protein
MATVAKARTTTTTEGKAGEQSLDSVYEELKALLLRHVPPFKACAVSRAQDKKSIQLTVPKPVSVPGAYGGKPVDLQMAAAILQKDYVGFYLMCIYMNEAEKNKLSPALVKLLKGKACFHVKKLDGRLRKDIASALEMAAKNYRELGWV